MKNDLLILFFAYSFLGWAGETAVATLNAKRFVNRGFLTGPFCLIYGVAGVLISVTLRNAENAVFVFGASTTIATVTELCAAKILEKFKRKKWWDYSKEKWNYDGYICLKYSLLWGVLGTAAVYFVNDLILWGCAHLPEAAVKAALLVLSIYTAADMVVSIPAAKSAMTKISGRVKNAGLPARAVIKAGRVLEGRIEKAYPVITEEKENGKNEQCGVKEIIWLFVIGAFLGDIVETVFCRFSMGTWMSRSSVVWGPFSVVWGLGLAFGSALLHKARKKPDRVLFATGCVLGGVYEYVCSVFTEVFFGTVFWDYSKIPFNLGGRINLLFCFFWGIAVVLWLKGLYPYCLKMIKRIISAAGNVCTVALAVFMSVNVIVSCIALKRYDERSDGIEPRNAVERIVDERFDDGRMEKIYPNAKKGIGQKPRAYHSVR